MRALNALLPAGQYGLFFALFRCRSIRALLRPVSLPLNTGFVAPYFAVAQYGLCCALFRCRSIRALLRPISLSLNTGFVAPCFAAAQYGLCCALFRCRSIRALLRPVSLPLNTGFVAPCFAVAQYGRLLRLFRPVGAQYAFAGAASAPFLFYCLHRNEKFSISRLPFRMLPQIPRKTRIGSARRSARSLSEIGFWIDIADVRFFRASAAKVMFAKT